MRAMRMYYPRGFCGIKSKSKIKNVFENLIFPYPERERGQYISFIANVANIYNMAGSVEYWPYCTLNLKIAFFD